MAHLLHYVERASESYVVVVLKRVREEKREKGRNMYMYI